MTFMETTLPVVYSLYNSFLNYIQYIIALNVWRTKYDFHKIYREAFLMLNLTMHFISCSIMFIWPV